MQNYLETVFDEFMLQFINEMHSIQLQYQVEKKKQILVFVQIFHKSAEKAILMYVIEMRDLEIIKAYLSGIVLTLAVWYVNDV